MFVEKQHPILSVGQTYSLLWSSILWTRQKSAIEERSTIEER